LNKQGIGVITISTVDGFQPRRLRRPGHPDRGRAAAAHVPGHRALVRGEGALVVAARSRQLPGEDVRADDAQGGHPLVAPIQHMVAAVEECTERWP
jgi:hypothetical protein